MKFDYHRNHRLLVSLIVLGFLALALIIAVGPAIWVMQNNEPLEAMVEMDELVNEGLGVYVAEGCIGCHTQQVRPLEMDAPYGRPSTPGDWANTKQYDWLRTTPALLGTQRTGPDLANVGTRQPSDVWQYMHLYNPRSVVPDSVMPGYPWLFEVKAEAGPDDFVVPLPDAYAPAEGVVVPNREGEALVAYMLYLRQAPLASAAAGPEAEAGAEEAAPAETPGGGEEAGLAGLPDGAPLYSANCASCHQANGAGLPGAFPSLVGNDVVTADDPEEHIHIALFGLQGKTIDGVDYSSPMPAFDFLSDEELAAVINHERTSWGNDAPTVSAGDVARVREAGE